jgi:hypothetical protein
MFWLYVQTTGEMFRPDGSLSGTGYSGHGPGTNKPVFQHIRNEGPIPAGLYTIGTPIDHPMLGPVAIPLSPDPSNQMFGRSHFWIHGDNKTHDASLGCIIQQRSVREEIAGSAGSTLKVIARPAPVEVVT